jgi:hypothetical protein
MEEEQLRLPPDEKLVFMWSELEKMEARLSAANDLLGSGIAKVERINTQYADYFEKSDPTLKSKSEIVNETVASIDQSLRSASDLKSNLEEFRLFVYGNEATGIPGFKKDLEGERTALVKKTEEATSKWESSYQTLYDKINGLLPRATATGLSHAYQEQKRSLIIPIIISSVVLLLSLAAMMAFSWDTFSSIKTLEDSLKGIVARLPFFIPAVWLAYLAAKQQNKYQRLQQEYIYKETLSKSFEAYKREVDLLPEGDKKTELQHELIKSMVVMFGFNPSVTLEHTSHDERHPFWGQVGMKKLKKIKEETLATNGHGSS